VAEDKNIQKAEINALLKDTREYSSIVDYAKDLTCHPILKTNCKLCNSIYRIEAEEMFADGKNPHQVYKWLKSKKEDISDKAVHNHYVEHYLKPIIETRIKTYAENLENYSKIKMQDEDRLRLYSSLLDQQIHMLASAIHQTNPEEMRKSHETLIKLIDQATKVQERINNLQSENEPVKILIERLNNVMTIKWNDAKSPEAKQAIQDILDVVVKETEILNVNK
jgi:hypothetical protein